MTQEKKRRRNYFIEKKFQSRFVIQFCLVVILASLMTALALYLFSDQSTTVSFQNLRAVAHTTTDYLIPLLIQTVLISAVIVGIATMIVALFISHGIAGPLYRFKKELNMIESGDLTSNFRIRKEDQLQDIASSVSRMTQKLREAVTAVKQQCRVLEENNHDDQMQKSVKEMKKNLDHFKV